MHNLYYVNWLELLSTNILFFLTHVFFQSSYVTHNNTTSNGLDSSLWLIYLGAVKEEELNPRYSWSYVKVGINPCSNLQRTWKDRVTVTSGVASFWINST